MGERCLVRFSEAIGKFEEVLDNGFLGIFDAEYLNEEEPPLINIRSSYHSRALLGELEIGIQDGQYEPLSIVMYFPDSVSELKLQWDGSQFVEVPIVVETE